MLWELRGGAPNWSWRMIAGSLLGADETEQGSERSPGKANGNASGG